MCSAFKFLKYLAIFVAVNPSNALNVCQTPNGLPGDCKPIQNCSSLYHHHQNKYTREEICNYISRAECGFVDEIPKVCCPIQNYDSVRFRERVPFVNSSLLPSTKICGPSPRYMIWSSYGKPTQLDEYPWMALLDYEVDDMGTREFKCGGALINKRYVLTAAHCIEPSLVSVRLGEWNIKTEIDCDKFGCMDPPRNIPIEEKIPFKSYDFNRIISYHDIGLLRLKQEVEYSDYIKPICLPTTVDEIFNKHLEEELTVAGWGMTETGQKSNIKIKVKVPVTTCSKLKNLVLDAGQICAGGVQGRDSCKGDSGGPLMSLQIEADKSYARWYAVGVVSFGEDNCGRSYKPAVYTRVSKYIHWIVDNLKP